MRKFLLCIRGRLQVCGALPSALYCTASHLRAVVDQRLLAAALFAQRAAGSAVEENCVVSGASRSSNHSAVRLGSPISLAAAAT